MKNPFIYGEAVTGDNFCNRKEEIIKLSSDLIDSQKIFLISSRRFGKTSLIKMTLEEVKKKNIKTIYLDIEGISTYKKFLNYYLNALVKEFTPLNKIYEFAKHFLKGVHFELSVDERGSPTISLGYKQQEMDLDNLSLKIFELPSRIAKRHSVVVVFDEFQEILKLNGQQLEALLRSVIQHQRNVGYIFAGSKRHLMLDIVTSPDRPFYKIGPIIHLSEIPTEEIKKFIHEKFYKTKIKINNETVEKIIKISENIPYYVQMICHELWDFAIISKKEVGEKDVDNILVQILRQYDQNYREIWNKLSSNKMKILHTIATTGGRNILSKDSLEKNDLGYPSGIQRTLQSLMLENYIDKYNEKYFITDIIFQEWIKRFTV